VSDLYPTPSRLDLLRAVAAGEVFGSHHHKTMKWRVRWGQATVTSRVTELAVAGWVGVGASTGWSYYARKPYELTDAGRAVLDGAS
jgi:hypothetical protein